MKEEWMHEPPLEDELVKTMTCFNCKRLMLKSRARKIIHQMYEFHSNFEYTTLTSQPVYLCFECYEKLIKGGVV